MTTPPRHYYQISLTAEEYGHLAWLVDRGYFPEETYDAMESPAGDDYPGEAPWTIPEWAAWALCDAREEDPYALFSCTGGPLLDKLLALEESII